MAGDEVERITPSPSKAVSRWLNVVLDLNGVLYVYTKYRFLAIIIARNPEFALHSSSDPTRVSAKAVYVHLSYSTFLNTPSAFVDIIVWNSMHKLTVHKICEHLFKRLPMPVGILGQDSCD